MKQLLDCTRWAALLLSVCMLIAGCGQLAASANSAATPAVWGVTSAAQPITPTQAHTTPTPQATLRATTTPTPKAKPPPTARPVATPHSGLPVVAATTLPPEAQKTLALIAQGGPFPFERDGVEFQNREQLLPRARRGYYREYTVVTPGERDRGARRIITGSQGEIYYTPDHYASFVQVLPE